MVRAMDAWLAALDEPFEGLPFPVLADALPDGGVLWAGNSMPVRDLDGWLPSTERAITVRSNRGANGIDGVVSTALGSAAVADGPVALVVGDISFLHDLNALVAAKLHGLSATIVLVNNDGGGIFSFLPQAQPGVAPAGSGLPEHYEELFGTPHGIDVAPDRRGPRRRAPPRDARRPARGRRRLRRAAGRARPRAPDRPGAERAAAPRGRGGRRPRARDRRAAPMSTMTVDGLRWEVRVRGAGRPLLLLHGFTGRGTSWGTHATAFARRARVITVDLPGHGRSGTAAPDRMTVERTADDLAAILRRLDAVPADVVGYSLGARIALRLAIAHPDVVGRLVLESPSAGIADAAERAARRTADAALADRVERDGIDAFVDEWERQPVFASHAALPPATAARIRTIRLANTRRASPRASAARARARWSPLFDRLPAIDRPTLVIAGALDDRGRPRAEGVARRHPRRPARHRRGGRPHAP